MSLRDTRISTRLAIGIGMAVALLFAMVWIGASRLGAVKSRLDLVTGVQQPKINQARHLGELLRRMDVSLRDIVLLNDEAAMLKEIERFTGLREAYRGAEKRLLDAEPATSEAGAVLERARQAMLAMDKPVDKAIRLGAANKPEEATRVLLQEIRPLGDQALAAIDELTLAQVAAGEQAQRESEQTYREALAGLGVVGALAALLLAVSGWWLVRSITRPLNAAVRLARAIAAGDLGQSIEASGKGSETGQLLNALKEMQGSLVGVVQGVREKAENVASGSSQISQGNNDLALRTERQASALAQAASSMRQLGLTVAQNSDNARKADGLVNAVSSVAGRGADAVGRVVATMQDINARSRLIADIIGVIDGITFQTNILALNAGVEAARAGDQGRGFAVVAGEVRSLAQRSATASKEISALISASVQGVEQGTVQVDAARQTMGEMMSSVQSLRSLMAEIRDLSAAQSADVSQAVDAVVQMDNTTQQNAALVEESAAAAESLRTQAEQLVQAVAVFHLGATGLARQP
jgi:methyl-accepting chemotaxis protein